MGDLVALLSTPNGDNNNNALHSSSSAHAPNNHEVNYDPMGEEQLLNDLEEDDEEQLSDELEEDDEAEFGDDSEDEDQEYSD
ncbi:hypothetical protein P8452_30429 [Trifolium repens]|nr:hypothetical protein P8452_30429 [Trifolium repens]